MSDFDVIIIGAGISGLSTANYLSNSDLKIKVLEAEDGPGGRVRSYEKEGFILDRGFQVFLPAYPEARNLLSYEQLDLQYFMNGACVVGESKPFFIVDPLNSPKYIFNALFDSNVSLSDKLKLFQLRQSVLSKSVDSIFSAEELKTREKIKKGNYSLNLIRSFFQPFLAGIFFENALNTSSRMFEFVIKMFNEGGAAVPKNGMGEISNQLFNNLNPGVVDFNTRVSKIDGLSVVLENGKTLKGNSIVLAVEGNSELLGDGFEVNKDQHFSSTYYFSCPGEIPIKEPILILNRNESLNINNLCFQSQVSDAYAKENNTLLSVTVINNSKEINDKVIHSELVSLFGEIASDWKFIDRFLIPYSLPDQSKVKGARSKEEINPKEGLYIAGDHGLYGSLNAAMQSGREVAELILNQS